MDLLSSQAKSIDFCQFTEVAISLFNAMMGDYLVTAGTVRNLRLVCETKQNLVNNKLRGILNWNFNIQSIYKDCSHSTIHMIDWF